MGSVRTTRHRKPCFSMNVPIVIAKRRYINPLLANAVKTISLEPMTVCQNTLVYNHSRNSPSSNIGFPMPLKSLSEPEQRKLMSAAKTALKHAYAPYSRFRVGAALLTTQGKMFLGCNVENASYGMTNCAERTAIFAAVAHAGPKMRIRAIAVVNDRGVRCSPCGACRQVIFEFGPKAVVLFPDARGYRQAAITDLLPAGFRL